MADFEILTSPIDYFYKIAALAKSEVSIDENGLHYIISNNKLCCGVSELLPSMYGSFAINTSCFFTEGFYSINRYLYEQNWLYALILIEEDKCFINIARFKSSNIKTTAKDGFELREVNTKEIHWKQLDNTYSNKIILYISDDWLKKTLNFIPSIDANDWKFLRDAVRENTFNEVNKEHPISILCSDILQNLTERSSASIESRQEKISTLLFGILNIILGSVVVSTKNIHKKALEGIILAHDELIKNFRNPPLDLAELSKISGLNRQKFQNYFKEYYGKSFYQYYQIKRFDYAKHLIEFMGYTVSEAAYTIGYKHLGHFCQAFTKIHGLKPSEVKHKTTN